MFETNIKKTLLLPWRTMGTTKGGVKHPPFIVGDFVTRVAALFNTVGLPAITRCFTC
jgi:hypothetical protein